MKPSTITEVRQLIVEAKYDPQNTTYGFFGTLSRNYGMSVDDNYKAYYYAVKVLKKLGIGKNTKKHQGLNQALDSVYGRHFADSLNPHLPHLEGTRSQKLRDIKVAIDKELTLYPRWTRDFRVAAQPAPKE